MGRSTERRRSEIVTTATEEASHAYPQKAKSYSDSAQILASTGDYRGKALQSFRAKEGSFATIKP